MSWQVQLAYIDPVSGSILIQTILAAVAGGITFFRKSLWDAIRRLTGGRTDDNGANHDAPAPGPDKDSGKT
jgi:hypothetical protein